MSLHRGGRYREVPTRSGGSADRYREVPARREAPRTGAPGVGTERRRSATAGGGIGRCPPGGGLRYREVPVR